MSTDTTPDKSNLDLFDEEAKDAKKRKSSKTTNQPVADNYSDEVKFSENALKVISKRYLIKDENRQPIETPKGMLERVAKVVAAIDAKYDGTEEDIKKSQDDFFELMANLEFLPNSPTFTGAGTKIGQLSACFVLPVEDDMTEILRTQMNMGLIHKSGGGTGFSFSRLRPKNDLVGTTGGISCGPIGFMQMFNDTTEQIKQGGTRRGANMGILRVDHPDIIDFIKYKSEEGKLTNFNISVGITKEFMQALEKDEDYALINPRTKQEMKRLQAKEVFDLIVEHAWKNGEPGLVFLDLINAAHPTPQLGEIESTNPCGEQPLLPYESCNLGAINVAKMIKKTPDGNIDLDISRLTTTVKKAVHFLDNIIDANKYPIKEISDLTLKTRKMGISVMGFADLLFQMKISYNSEEGLALAEKIMSTIEKVSHETSSKLAKSRGNFPAYEGSKWDKAGIQMHNAATTSCNPTGTLSIIASCSSGIEPVFALAYVKTVMDGTALPELNPYFMNIAKERGFYSEELVKKVLEHGTVQDIDEVPEDVKKVFVVAQDIEPDWHVRMQAAFQAHTDAGISKTINFPNSATQQEVAEAYKLAYKLGCKGITIYRDGSRALQVLTVGHKDKSKETETNEPTTAEVPAVSRHIVPRKRPDVVNGTTYRVRTGYGNLYITINNDENGDPFELFAHIGKTGGFFAAKAEAICRLISLALRSGIDPQEIYKDLKGIRGPSPIWGSNGSMVLSMPDAIGQIMERHIQHHEQQQLSLGIPATQPPTTPDPESTPSVSANIASVENPPAPKRNIADYGHAPVCPECSNLMEIGEGCLKCPSCGYSKCG